jgi:hypothetical protein
MSSGNLLSKSSDLFSLPINRIPELPVLLPFSQKLCLRRNQAPTNELVQDAPIQLLEGAQAAHIFIVQLSDVQGSHDLWP